MKSTLVLFTLLGLTLLLPPAPAQANNSVPAKTDDGLDPVNLIFTGYAPAWWVVQSLRGWNPTPCTEPKSLDGKTYDFALETPDTRGQTPPCWGPRFHVRIWNMGMDPGLGQWSIGAVHHEHTECSYILFCYHVIDGWEGAESLVQSTLLNGPSTVSISNYTVGNSGLYQGFYNDGNATSIQLSRPSMYPVIFVESGLEPGTSWTVTLNGETSSSSSNRITFSEPNGTYQFVIHPNPGYDSPSTPSNITVQGAPVEQSVAFTQTQFTISFKQSGLPAGTRWSVTLDGATSYSTTNTIMFTGSRGAYSYTIGNVLGYRATSSSGTSNVTGDQTIAIRFRNAPTIDYVVGQPGALLFLTVTLAAWAAVLVAAVFATMQRRRMR